MLKKSEFHATKGQMLCMTLDNRSEFSFVVILQLGHVAIQFVIIFQTGG